MLDKIIIISWSNYDQRIGDQFDVLYLINNGYVVEYWDVSNITIPGYSVKNCIPPEGLVNVKFENKKEFIGRVNKERHSYFIVYMNCCPKSFFCYRILSKFNCFQIYWVNGVLPAVSKITRYSQYIRILSLDNILQIFQKIIFSLLLNTKLIRPVNILLKTCDIASNKGGCKINDKTKVFPFNTLDFQQTLLQNNVDPFPNERYIVFLDQYLPFHPDNKMRGINYDPSDYFMQMNHFFNRIEEKLSCKVIIAGHPAVEDRQSYCTYFNGRKVVYDNTMVLIKNSIATIAHFSTAVSYSVIFKKKIFFVFSEDMKNTSPLQYSMGNNISSMLKSRIIELNNKSNFDIDFDLDINLAAYDNYKHLYLVNRDSQNEQNGKLLIDSIS